MIYNGRIATPQAADVAAGAGPATTANAPSTILSFVTAPATVASVGGQRVAAAACG